MMVKGSIGTGLYGEFRSPVFGRKSTALAIRTCILLKQKM